MLKKHLELFGQRVLIMHFADYLKFGCKEYLDWNGQKDEFGRTLLQQTGTEGIRARHPDFWVDCISKWIDGALAKKYDVFLLPDTRFPNEIDYFKKFPFHTPIHTFPVRVHRLEFESTLSPEQQQHASEVALDEYEFDYYIYCPSGLDSLEVATLSLVEHLLQIVSQVYVT